MRIAAARSLLFLTRNLKKQEQRNELYSTLIHGMFLSIYSYIDTEILGSISAV